jgi:hypothetical protein
MGSVKNAIVSVSSTCIQARIGGNPMRKLLLTAVATATIILAGSAMWKAEAAMPSGAAQALPPLANAATPLETVGCWCGPYRCACRRWWWGPGVYRYHRWGWRPGVYRWRY